VEGGYAGFYSDPFPIDIPKRKIKRDTKGIESKSRNILDHRNGEGYRKLRIGYYHERHKGFFEEDPLYRVDSTRECGGLAFCDSGLDLTDNSSCQVSR
jgi:hypothetical protein